MTLKDYVTRDVADLLLEKGYCEISDCFYEKEESKAEEMKCESKSLKDQLRFTVNYLVNAVERKRLYAPSLYDAQKWIREKFEMHVNADYDLYKSKWFFYYVDIVTGYRFDSAHIYESYEEALNKGIFSTLEFLIENKR